MNFGGATWRKSSYSSHNGSCVEVAFTGPAVGIRDSKNTASGQLTIAPAGWTTFIANVKRRGL